MYSKNIAVNRSQYENNIHVISKLSGVSNQSSNLKIGIVKYESLMGSISVNLVHSITFEVVIFSTSTA